MNNLCSERPRQDLPNGALFGNGVLPVVAISTRRNLPHPWAITRTFTDTKTRFDPNITQADPFLIDPILRCHRSLLDMMREKNACGMQFADWSTHLRQN